MQLEPFLILILAVIPLIQYGLGIIPFSGNAWLASIYLAAFAFMVLAAQNMTATRASSAALAAQLAIFFVLAATLSTWIALRQYFQLADSIWEINHNIGRPYGNLAQPNNLATLLGMGLAGCLYFYEKGALGRASVSILALFLLMGIAVTQSRTPWVTSIAIIGFWALKSRHFVPRLNLSWMICWVLLYAAIVLILSILNEWLALGGSSLVHRGWASGRLSLWAQLWYAVWHGPFWGYGWNQTVAAQLSVMVEWPLSMMATYSHNLLLDLLLWNGLIPGTLIILAFGGWLVRICKLANSKESMFALVAAGFILIHSLLEYPFAYAYFLLPLGLLLGIAGADVPATSMFRVPRTVLVAILISGVWLLKATIMDYAIIKADYQAQRMAAAKVIGFESDTSVTEVVFLTQLRELQKFRATEPRSGYDDDQLEWMGTVVQQYPHLANLYRYALVLMMNGKADQAEHYLKLLCKLHGDKYCEQAKEQFHNAMQRAPL